MGVFDFVKNAGAKIGIGKSTDEEAAEEAAAAAAEAAAEAKEARDARRAALRGKAVAAATERKKEAMAKAAMEASQRNKLKAAAQERMAEYKKSSELETYVKGLGINIDGIDIRFDDETAYISGEAVDQATKERIILAVGNAHGVARVDEDLDVAAAGDEAEFHTVESGDTLWAIAQEVYGDGNRYPEIFEANKPMLKDPDQIFPGQVLRCPK